MSRIKKFSLALVLLIAIVSGVMFGCGKSKSVKEIRFNLGTENQIVLIVGESLEMKDYITFKPSNASNKKYTLSSFDENVVRIEKGSIVAVAEGTAQIKVVSKDDKLKQDLMSVVVKNAKTVLDTPRNLVFNSETQLLRFDKVTYATSYTVKINNEEIQLGNSTVFPMSMCENAYNSLLNIQIKANSPTYTKALEDSEYSAEYKLYQAGGVENVEIKNGDLTFDKTFDALNVNVYLNNILVAENSSETTFSLKELNEELTGLSTQVKIETIITDEIKNNYSDDVNYFNSAKKSVNLNILDAPIVSVNHSTLSWQNIPYCAGYSLLVNDEEVAVVHENYIDLTTLEDFDEIISAEEVNTIVVEPIINDLTKNVGRTTRVNSVRVKRLEEVEIECVGHGIEWSAVDNALSYVVILEGGDETLLDVSTNTNSYSLLGQAAGEYHLSVQAVGGYVSGEDVYYISSKAVTKDFNKSESVLAEIEDYILKVSDLGTATCYVEFDNTEFNTTLTGNDVELDLTAYSFTPGQNSITLIRKDNEDSILSELFVVNFVQLDAVTNLRIEDGCVKFDTTEINESANITLKTSDEFGVVQTVENIESEQHQFNSTDAEGENYLPAGNYTVSIYVEGDGKSTFSVIKDGEVAAETFEFVVLSVPDVELKSVDESILTMNNVEDANGFNVFSVVEENHELVGYIESAEYEFSWEGSVSYAVQSVGNGSTTLDSVVGETVTIQKLETPTLTYNSAEEMFTKTDELNDASVVERYELTINGEVIDYDFESKITLLEDTTATLKAIPVDNIDNMLYLASDTTELVLTKIINEVIVTNLVGEHDDLIILHEPAEEYRIEVEFTFGSDVILLTADEEKNLVDEEGNIITTYGYSLTESEPAMSFYTIPIIVEDRYIYEELDGEFSMRVRFINISTGEDTNINSEFTELIGPIVLESVVNDAVFTINENSQLVIYSEINILPRGLVLVINDDENLTFRSNGEKLVSNNCELTYTHDLATGCYLVNLLAEDYSVIDEAFDSEFTVKVRFTLYKDTTETNKDSDFGYTDTVHILPTATMAREGQSLKITHPLNDYTFNNYGLLINNKYLLRLTEDGITQGEGGILVDINYVFNSDASSVITDTNTMTLVVLNIASTDDYLEISRKGNTLSVCKTPAVQLREVKNNGVDENSVMIEFDTYETNYNKDYYVYFHNDSGDVIKTLRFVDDDADENGKISIKIDSIEELPEVFYVEAQVACLATDNGNEMFSSNISNKIELSKIQATSGLRVSESVLTFVEVENAVGYEVYEDTGTGYVKINTGLISTNQYTFGDLTGTRKIVVKAIANSGGFSNSVYSEPITIKSLSALSAKVQDGDIILNFPLQVLLLAGQATLVPEITNPMGEIIEINLDDESEDIKLEGFSSLRIAPHVLLAYNTESLQPEEFKFKLKIRYDETEREEYYLNTALINFVAHGLIAPTEVKKTTDEHTKVEFITWQASEKNTLDGEAVEVGYVFKLEYQIGELETRTYYSNDPKLKYYDSATDSYLSYPAIISDTSTIFPAGYDGDDDGEINDLFRNGTYTISVKSVPIGTIDGYNICNSVYTSASEFNILKQTVLKVNEGVLTWNEQSNASKYKVEVYEKGETETIVTDYVTTASYDFTNPALNAYSGVLRVVVTAISNRDDTLCGQASESLFVYRLPEATAVHVDDGKLIVSGNKYFSKAIVEFVDTTTNKKYVENYENESAITNISALGIATWDDLADDSVIHETFKFALDLSSDILAILDGRDYTVNVILQGNSNDAWGTITSSRAINVSKLQATKMNVNVTEVTLGVLQYMPNSNYATVVTDPEISYTSLVDLNYAFNGATSTDFWHNTAVYKIKVSKSDNYIDIYAVDYYSLIYAINNGTIATEEYEILDRTNGLYAVVKYKVSPTEIIYFNVYKENKLNLRDYDELAYYEVNETMVNGSNLFASTDEAKALNLADGGSFVITITMLGGDSKEIAPILVGQLNAGTAKLNTFIRYGINTLSSNDGRLQFADLIPIIEDEIRDVPVYRVVVTPFNTDDDTVMYLYYESLEQAQDIAARHGDEEVDFYQLIQDESIEGVVFFDIANYINAGTYKITIQTLAGVGVTGEDYADYLLNAKAPTTAYTFYRLTDTEFYIDKGVLMFEQSYIVRDGEKIYNEEYEVTVRIYEDESVYKENIVTINRASENAIFDDVAHTVKYILPSSMEIEGEPTPILASVEHEIKIRPISTENFILNGTYSTDPTDEFFAFSKSEGVEDLRIEDGMLKWRVLDLEHYTNTVIKVTFLDRYNEPHDILITVGDLNRVEDNGEYLYHFYKFTSEKFNGYKIENGVDYVISAYTKGNDDVINSDYCVEISAQRLATIDSSSIKTMDGILTWDFVENASHYEVTIDGEVYEAHENLLNVSNLELEAGTYSVNIKAIGQGQITGEPLVSAVQGFVQLDVVDIATIQVGGNQITWDSVEGAQGYSITFNYTDLEGNYQFVEEILSSNEYTIQVEGLQGTFSISITAVGVGEGKAFNGKTITYTSSSNAPMAVSAFSFDSDNSRFVIEVNNSEFLSSDSLLIVYNFEEYTSQTELTVARRITTSISYQQTNSYEVVDEMITRYYLPIKVMAKYTNVYVQVDRPNTLSSIKTQTDDVDFHLFSYGEGTEANPYRIYTGEQLLNISYFTSSNYVFTSSVDLTGTNITERLNANGGVIANEFSGVIDGKNFSILGFNLNDDNGTDVVTLENRANFALFETLNGATIKNLIIGKEDVQLVVSNTFSINSRTNVNYSMLATRANSSTIDNIKVLDYKVELTSSTTKSMGGIYVGGLINEINSTTISNSLINFTSKVDLTTNNIEVYIGGVSAKAVRTNFNGSQVKLAVETRNENIFSYIGGAFAYYEGNVNKSTGITNSTAELNIANVQVSRIGGFAGFARYIVINSSETTGTYTKTNIAYNAYIGGLVGEAQSATITASGSFMNLNIAVSNTTNKYIGAIVGRISIYNGISAEITNCYSHVYVEGQEETVVSTSGVVVGIFGESVGTNIQGNYKKEQE